MNSQGGGGGGNQGGGAKAIGFAAVLQAEGYDFSAPETVVAELKWQKSVNGETAKNEAFVERVLGLQEFKAFGIMKGGSPWVQMAHGFGKFYSLYGTVPELDGKALMFVGDRGVTRDPVAVQPPVQNTWKWITVNAATDEAALLAFAQREGEMGLWTPGAGNHAPQDLKVPYVLALPGVLVEFIHGNGGQCRPHELLMEVQRLAGAYPTISADNWELVRNWCFVAAQAKADGDSHAALKILPAISADKSFLEWCERRIDGTMGLRVREIGGPPGLGGGGQTNLITTTANVVRDMGTQMVAGFRQAINASSQLGGGGTEELQVERGVSERSIRAPILHSSRVFASRRM
jgi:hypothetical protein